MLSVAILTFSVIALLKWMVACCRSVVLASQDVEVSRRTCEMASIPSRTLDPAEFERVMGLARMAPYPRNDSSQVRAVTTYFRMLRLASTIFSPLSTSAKRWFTAELSLCAHFAAVTLDRRMVPSGS